MESKQRQRLCEGGFEGLGEGLKGLRGDFSMKGALVNCFFQYRAGSVM